ncbi:fibrinogen C domain-containing protein 1-like [Homarus americanus]|uniref:fibrinogen C domain-containing protein 1-like n=1 Tax=Homarus americanus TaxID=6706 RepID=UPI001C43F6FB|nr:fibrinogen C domain-containing protein 1-like [Homarus americanus]
MDCLDLLTDGHTQDGVYKIYPAGVGVEVWCEQSSAGGGWTVVGGRRVAHQVNFTRPAFHYTRGFGDPAANHWIGVEVMHALTRHAPNTLRVHLVDHLQQSANATYSNFSVGGPEDQYRLQVEGYDPSSTAGDALTPHSGAPFSSPLHLSGNNCSNELGVGWWFMDAPDCYLALPTGHYHTPGHYQGTGVWSGDPGVVLGTPSTRSSS